MRTQWVFIEPCGCPFGVMEGSFAPDEIEAWFEFYDGSRRKVREARQRGVEIAHVSHAEYERDFYPKMRSDYTCPHRPVAP